MLSLLINSTASCRSLAKLTVAFLVLNSLFLYQCLAFVMQQGATRHDSRLFVSVVPYVAPLPPADLTPAVDKFLRMPDHSTHGTEKNSYWLSATGPAPPGADPFQLVNDELKSLSDYVKELVVSENPVLTMAASHFFQQVFSFNSLFLAFFVTLLYCLFCSDKENVSDQRSLLYLAELLLLRLTHI